MGVIIVYVFLIILALSPACITVSLTSKCLMAGYTDGKVGWSNFALYCVSRQEQSDLVVPLSEAIKTPLNRK